MNGGEAGTGALSKETPDSRPALFLLAVSLGLGMFLRIHNLGEYGLWIDELFHAIAARSILETGSPVIPGMMVYDRAYPFTAVITFFFRNFGISEAVARAPSVMAGAVFLAAGYLLARRMFDRSLALLFAIVMAFSPLEILWDRQCRMYALFRLFYFSAAMLFYMGLEPGEGDRKDRGPRFLRRIEQGLGVDLFLLASAGILFFLSTRFHRLTYNFVFVLTAYCSIMLLASCWRGGVKGAFFSKYSAMIAAMAGGVLFIRLFSPGLYYGAIETIREKPFWDTYGLDYRYYLRYLWENYPVFLVTYPAGIWLLISRHGRMGLFVFCSFAPLFLLHMFLFTNNVNERYLLYIFPFFAIGSLFFLDFLLKKGRERLRDLRRRTDGARSAVCASLMLLLLAAASFPWAGSAFAVPQRPHFEDWKSVTSALKTIPAESVIISTRRMPIYYYYGRNPDYVIIREFEDLIRKEIRSPSRERPLFMDVGWLFSAEELEQVIRENDRVYFLLDTESYANPAFIDDGIRRAIFRMMTPVAHDGDRRILIFRKAS